MTMEELDRVLDRHDVVMRSVLIIVEESGERRRLTRTGDSRDEHEAAPQVGELDGQPAADRALRRS